MTEILSTLARAIERGDRAVAAELTRRAIDEAVLPADILKTALLPGMAVVGNRFREREIFLPDVLLSARAMKAAMALLEPLLVADDVTAAGRVVLGTVRGDLHDIGKNLVGIMLQGAGYHVIDIGVDAEADAFIDAAVEGGAPVIGMSALLTTTMTAMAGVVQRLHQRGLGSSLRTIVGGAPVSAEFAREIGADAYAADAPSAVDRIRTLTTAP
jgi:5-methyltetrahydrofolate--homocysteine methyltransferase